PRDLHRRSPQHALPGQPDVARVGLQVARDDVEAGGLARPVRSDQAGEAGSDVERDIDEDLVAAERLLHVDELHDRGRDRGGGHSATSRRRSRAMNRESPTRRASEVRPPGRTEIASISTSPYAMACWSP